MDGQSGAGLPGVQMINYPTRVYTSFSILTPDDFDSKGKRRTHDGPRAGGDDAQGLATNLAKRQKTPKQDEPKAPVVKRPRGRPKLSEVPKRKRAPRKAQTMLRRDRPVETSLPMDIWSLILGFCSLEKLLRLRGTCSTFHSALSQEQVWKEARLRQFGGEQPDPPQGLNEMQYADLLVGIGCHGADCKAKDTRRTYWAFRRRWCEHCMSKNSLRGRPARDGLMRYEDSSKCLPQARYDSWGHYQLAACHDHQNPRASLHDPQNPRISLHSGATIAFSRFDVAAFNARLVDFQTTNPTAEAWDEWFRAAQAANASFVEQLQMVEQWIEADRKEREMSRAIIRQKRIEFFRDSAAQMQPPLASNILQLCQSYVRSIRISKLPSKSSWQKLCPKLQDERALAEEKWQKIARQQYHEAYRTYLRETYEMNVERRRQFQTPEQKLVLSLARQILRDVVYAEHRWHPGDFTVRFFRAVYEAYQAIPDDEKPQTRVGPYRLIMDDARLVYDQVIEPEALNRFQAAERICATCYRCPALPCNGSTVLRDFESLMKHVYLEHRYSKEFEHLLERISLWGESSSRFPWYRVEWPRNLPMLIWYQRRPDDGHWDIDSEKAPEYVDPPDPPSTEDLRQDVFVEYRASMEPMNDIDFATSAVRALKVLSDAPLPKPIRMKVSLEFAKARSSVLFFQTMIPQDMETLPDALYRAGLESAFDGQPCYHCLHTGVLKLPPQLPHAPSPAPDTVQSSSHNPSNPGRESALTKFMDPRYSTTPYADGLEMETDKAPWSTRKAYGRSLDSLIEHYYDVHWDTPEAWEATLMDLPDGRSVRKYLDKDKTGKAWARFNTLFKPAQSNDAAIDHSSNLDPRPRTPSPPPASAASTTLPQTIMQVSPIRAVQNQGHPLQMPQVMPQPPPPPPPPSFHQPQPQTLSADQQRQQQQELNRPPLQSGLADHSGTVQGAADRSYPAQQYPPSQSAHHNRSWTTTDASPGRGSQVRHNDHTTPGVILEPRASYSTYPSYPRSSSRY